MRALFILVILFFTGNVSAQVPGQSFKNPIVVNNPDSVQYFEKQYITITGPIASTKELMREDGVIGYLNMFKD